MTTVAPSNLSTTYAYDRGNRLVGRTDPGPLRVAFVYDSMNYRTTQTYDGANRVVGIWDASNRRQTISYDAAGQRTEVQYTGGTRLTMGYDPLGRLTTMVDTGGTTTYAYDSRGMLVGKTDPGNLVQAYGYDSVGNRVLLVDPDGGRHTYSYDALNRKSTFVDASNRLFTAQYDADGRKTTVQEGTARKLLLAYDALGRAITLVQATSAGAPVGTIVDTYDAGGRKVVSSKSGVLYTYSYDNASRQTGTVAPEGCETFVYDTVNNKLVKWQQGQFPRTSTYDAAHRQLTMQYGAATTNYTFDKAGNTVLEDTAGVQTGYVYDGENRLTKKTDSDGSVTTYTYAGDGLRRTYQKAGQPVTTQVWDGGDYIGVVH